jgi:hypothetical protein
MVVFMRDPAVGARRHRHNVRSQRAPYGAALAMTAVLLASCGQSAAPSASHIPPAAAISTAPSDGATPGSTPGSTPDTPPVTPAATLKPAMQGLLDRHGIPPDAYLSAISGVVVEVAWSDLQPSPEGAIATGNAIDQMLAAVRALNAGRPSHPLAIKLRVDGGIHAPSWAKSLGGGGPITVTDPVDNVSGTVGRYWSEEYGRAYASFESLLAARYDAVPEIREVTMSRCTTVYDEPFIRDRNDSATVAALLGAGLTQAADVRCLNDQIDAHAVWRSTRSGLALSPYQRIDPAGSLDGVAVTVPVMTLCRSRLGARCVLENNSLRNPPQGGDYTTMYSWIQRMGAPISFQTAAPAKLGGLQTVIGIAAGMGASAVELPRGYGGLTPGALAPLGTQLPVAPH